MKIDKRYPIKAVKFIFYFYFLFFVLVSISFLISRGSFDGYQMYIRLAMTPQLALALLGLGLAYPVFGFVQRTFFFSSDFEVFKPTFIDAFALSGFALESQEDNIYVFKAKSRAKRYLSMYEDDIEVRVFENSLQIKGLRRDVGKILIRLHDFTRNRS